ncbi:MAG TPA: MBL fold metallo-hydrolase [Longimicrobiales bacterium]|nr:MBL fold metallo-hydrolase [Longimicrobiales bacterium]
MLLRRLYYGKLAQASYLIGCQRTGEAIVVDPHRDADLYLDVAREEAVRIRYVTETHIHADYLSGARQLAERAGAQLLLSGEGDETWQYRFVEASRARLLHDGDEIRVGRVRVEVLHTPGHTPEHLSFLVTDGAASEHPLALLTGDFVFVGDVGRPDLLERSAGLSDTMEAGARTLFRSLERVRRLPVHLQILPGHGAGSACGKALGAVPTSTLGYELLVNWAFQIRTEDEFVRSVLEDQPEPPRYFAHMKRMNRDGPPLLAGPPRPRRMVADSLRTVLESGSTLVDTRPAESFADGHVPGAIGVPLGDDFPGMAGWVLPYDRPIYFVSGSEQEALDAARDLTFIGLDASEGYYDREALKRWADVEGPLQATPAVDWAEAERAVELEDGVLLDVRGESEWREGHVAGARHIHFGSLLERAEELPRDRPLMLYCLGGRRSGIAASLLQAAGFDDVRTVRGGFAERLGLGLPSATG